MIIEDNREKMHEGKLTPSVNVMFGFGRGRFFGFGIVNIVEGLICAGVALLLIWVSPLVLTLKIILSIVYALPLFIFNLVGIHQEDLLRYCINSSRRKKNGSVHYLAPPIQSAKIPTPEIEEENNEDKDIKESLLWKISEKLQN